MLDTATRRREAELAEVAGALAGARCAARLAGLGTGEFVVRELLLSVIGDQSGGAGGAAVIAAAPFAGSVDRFLSRASYGTGPGGRGSARGARSNWRRTRAAVGRGAARSGCLHLPPPDAASGASATRGPTPRGSGRRR